MSTTYNHIASDDCFFNINLAEDPAAIKLSRVERDEYVSNQQAVLRLNFGDAGKGAKIDFASDAWDFRPFLQRGEKAPNPVIHFEDVPDGMKSYLKFFTNYFRKKENLKISTLYLRIAAIKSVLVKGILSSRQELTFTGITTQMIVDEIELRGLAPYAAHGYFYALNAFYDYLTRICGMSLLVSTDELGKHDEKSVKKSKQIDTRLPNIPKEVAIAIRKKALEVMDDENAEYRCRLVACALLMLFNLGVRIDDLLDFRTGDLSKEATEVKGYKISYITYFVHKLSRHSSEAFGHTIYASAECLKAFDTMLRIRLSQSASKDDDHLFVMGDKVVGKNPFGTQYYPYYMYLYHKDICSTDKYNEVFTPNSSCYLSPVNKKTLYFPDTRQYRVWLCNDLYARGVSPTYVEEHLKHLSQAMQNYYNRPEDRTPEYVAFAEKVFDAMLVEKVAPIGVLGAQIRESIEKFVKAKKINAVNDFDAVMDAVGEKVSIRAKTGGFCFKTSLIPCAEEKGTDPVMCAYNLCPNVYSFYYNVDFTYSEFRAHVEAYEQNMMKGMKNSMEKELIEIKGLIARSLKPQVAQLEKEFVIQGFKAIAEKHPNVIDIVKNLSTIKKEIKEWTDKKTVR